MPWYSDPHMFVVDMHTCKHRNVNSYHTCTYTSYTHMYTYIKNIDLLQTVIY